jgi:4-amino-4-deoxy-L-arabinose transferase-like glycosyltransferase
MEQLAARMYSLYGEQTAIPRAFSAGFWMLGGVFIFLLAKNISGSGPAAACSLAFSLLLPYAVTASRAFQPDSLMVMLIVIFWWSIENWGRAPRSWKWTLLAGISGGLAIFVKFPAAFFVLGGAFGVIFGQPSLVKTFKRPQPWLMAVLGVLPAGAYLYYGLYIDGFLKQQFGSRFYPEMWVSPFFYLRWFLKVQNVANVLWIMLALFGWLFFASRPTKIFLAGLWGAYLVYGLAFAHHISSHDYYSLPLIPIIALCLAPLAERILPFFFKQLKNATNGRGNRNLAHFAALALLLGTIALASVDQYIQQRTNDQRSQATFWADVGQTIGHQPGVLALTSDYGYPLAYYGWQSSDPWPLAPDISDFNETFTQLSSNKTYFLVTDFDEYARQPLLQLRLTKNYPVLAQGPGFILFDLYHPYPAK